MDLVQTLVDYWKKRKTGSPAQAPEGLCPNCWGKQEYDNQIRDLFEDKQIDVNNHQSKHAFIQDFVVNRVNGIRLKKGPNGYSCATCHIAYDKL